MKYLFLLLVLTAACAPKRQERIPTAEVRKIEDAAYKASEEKLVDISEATDEGWLFADSSHLDAGQGSALRLEFSPKATPEFIKETIIKALETTNTEGFKPAYIVLRMADRDKMRLPVPDWETANSLVMVEKSWDPQFPEYLEFYMNPKTLDYYFGFFEETNVSGLEVRSNISPERAVPAFKAPADYILFQTNLSPSTRLFYDLSAKVFRVLTLQKTIDWLNILPQEIRDDETIRARFHVRGKQYIKWLPYTNINPKPAEYWIPFPEGSTNILYTAVSNGQPLGIYTLKGRVYTNKDLTKASRVLNKYWAGAVGGTLYYTGQTDNPDDMQTPID